MEGEFESTATRLCFPLLTYLQGRPGLDTLEKKSLMDLRTAIDTALAYRPTLVLVKANKSWKKGLVAKESKRALAVTPKKEDEIEEKKRAMISRRPSSPSSSSCKRPKRKRVIMAVRPYTELSEEESTLTAMEHLLGRQFYECWWSWKKVWAPMSFIGSLLVTLFIGLILAWGELAEKHRVLILSATFPLLVPPILRQLSLTSIVTLRKALSTFEALTFLLEVSGFAVALSGLYCFNTTGWLMGVCLFLSLTLGFCFYDAFPTSVRKASRTILVIWSMFGCLLLALIYGKVSPYMCDYRWDLLHGVIEQTASKRSQWGFSIKEFCFNRCFNVVVMVIRLAYLTVKHPQDCVFIRSRVRIVDLPIVHLHHQPRGTGTLTKEDKHETFASSPNTVQRSEHKGEALNLANVPG